VTRIALPDRCVVVLIGAAGAGKSTLAARLVPGPEILSSDSLRRAIAGDEADQRASGAAFRALGRELERRLAAGGRAVIDATNLRRSDRRPWLTAARRHGVPSIAIVLDLPADEVRRQGRARKRQVPDAVVERQLAAMAALREQGLTALQDEGFDVVVRLASAAEVSAVLAADAPASAQPPEV
jgi:predicted kinase